jgi:hypothetical protein
MPSAFIGRKLAPFDPFFFGFSVDAAIKRIFLAIWAKPKYVLNVDVFQVC